MPTSTRQRLANIGKTLAAADTDRRHAMSALAAVISEAREEGIPITEIATLTGVSRPTIYALLERSTP